MLDYVRKGDTVVVESISRFARNTRDLLDLVEQLSTKGVEFVSQKEAIVWGDTQNAIFPLVAKMPKTVVAVGETPILTK